jgi:hypothetical protein
MISSRPLQAMLHFASVHFDGGLWRPFHELIRRMYLGPGVLFLNWVLKPAGCKKGEFRLIPRHSSTVAGDFNAFQSDLDLTVILDDSRLDCAGEVVTRYHRWKKRLPFMGELEIYSSSEHLRLERILQDESCVYPVIRRIRKLSWMEQALHDAPSRYHRAKMERSIAKILSKEDIDFSKHPLDYRAEFSERVKSHMDCWFEGDFFAEFSDETESMRQGIRSDYLATSLIVVQSRPPKPGELCLPEALIFTLLALTPRAHFEPSSVENLVCRLRSLPLVRKRWEEVSEIEYLTFQAVLRAQLSVSDADRHWLAGFNESFNLARSLARAFSPAEQVGEISR